MDSTKAESESNRNQPGKSEVKIRQSKQIGISNSNSSLRFTVQEDHTYTMESGTEKY